MNAKASSPVHPVRLLPPLLALGAIVVLVAFMIVAAPTDGEFEWTPPANSSPMPEALVAEIESPL